VDFIGYYIKAYVDEAEEGVVYGGYGPRLFGVPSQIKTVIELLRARGTSRRAVVQIFDAVDLVGEHREIPCTCTLQFTIRQRRLNLLVNMRSNDAWLGLPHDVFCFTMLQELVARDLAVDLGTYSHCVGSLHLYERDNAKAESYIAEGWMPTVEMPSMPPGTPWPAVSELLRFEEALRTRGVEGELPSIPYWADLGRLLVAFARSRDGRNDAIQDIRSKMDSQVYDTYLRQKQNVTMPRVSRPLTLNLFEDSKL